MKFLKKLTIILLNILLVPLSIILSFGTSYFILDIKNKPTNIIYKLISNIGIADKTIF